MSRSRVCESSADNGSSISRIAGWTTSARAIPTRCCMPPESCRGNAPVNSSRPQRASASRTRSRRAALPQPMGQTVGFERQLDVAGNRAPGQEREVLEYVGDRVEALGRRLAARDHLAGGGREQPTEDAQQRRLATAGGADHGQHPAVADGEAQAVEHGQAAVVVSDAARFDLHRRRLAAREPRRPRRRIVLAERMVDTIRGAAPSAAPTVGH